MPKLQAFARENWFSVLVLLVIGPLLLWQTPQMIAAQKELVALNVRVMTLEKTVSGGREERLNFQRDVDVHYQAILDRLARIETKMDNLKRP